MGLQRFVRLAALRGIEDIEDSPRTLALPARSFGPFVSPLECCTGDNGESRPRRNLFRRKVFAARWPFVPTVFDHLQ